MSDDPVLAALGRLEVGQAAMRSDLMGRMDRLQDVGTALRAEFTALRAEFATLRGELMGRIDRLQNAIAMMRDDMPGKRGLAR